MAQPAAHLQFRILEGERTGTVFVLTGPATIGRSPGNAIRLPGTQISRAHASLRPTERGYVLQDLESRNGVFVNGRPVREQLLRTGDEVRIGPTLLVLEPVSGPPFDRDDDRATETPDETGPATSEPPALVVTRTEAPEEALVTVSYDAGALASSAAEPPEDPKALARAHARLGALYEIGTLVSAQLDLGPLLREVAARVREALDADRCLVLLGAGERAEDLEPAAYVSVREGGPIRVSSTLLRRVLEEGKSVRVGDARLDVRLRDAESVKLSGARSLCAAPLRRVTRTIGALYVDTTRPDRLFDDEDLRLLSAVAAQAAVAIENARLYASARAEVREWRARASGGSPALVGGSPPWKALLEEVRKVAPTDSTVLLSGETGTGKEVVARSIHDYSRRRERPFIAVNCAAVTESLLESELFGHERGAFTGAYKTKPGKFELADGGTLFLDEVGELSPATQTKLLRVLEERRFDRVGGVRRIAVDVRILAATNRDLGAEVAAGRFRQDLFYRLAVVPFRVPPLRERPDDIAELARHFLRRFARDLGKPVTEISDEALAALGRHRWPGNVRELQNVIERAVVLTDRSRVDVEDLPPGLSSGGGSPRVASPTGDLSLPDIVAETERVYIARALEVAKGRKVEAARLLGISRPTLDKKIQLHGIGVVKGKR